MIMLVHWYHTGTYELIARNRTRIRDLRVRTEFDHQIGHNNSNNGKKR